jgi:hypothetical protein
MAGSALVASAHDEARGYLSTDEVVAFQREDPLGVRLARPDMCGTATYNVGGVMS